MITVSQNVLLDQSEVHATMLGIAIADNTQIRRENTKIHGMHRASRLFRERLR